MRDHEDSPGRNLFGIVNAASTRSRGDSVPFDSYARSANASDAVASPASRAASIRRRTGKAEQDQARIDGRGRAGDRLRDGDVIGREVVQGAVRLHVPHRAATRARHPESAPT